MCQTVLCCCLARMPLKVAILTVVVLFASAILVNEYAELRTWGGAPVVWFHAQTALPYSLAKQSASVIAALVNAHHPPSSSSGASSSPSPSPSPAPAPVQTLL
jgi:hypothetical protein